MALRRENTILGGCVETFSQKSLISSRVIGLEMEGKLERGSEASQKCAISLKCLYFTLKGYAVSAFVSYVML